MRTATPSSRLHRRVGHLRREGGVVLIITLIALVIMMVGGAALVRSMNASQFLSGNLAFKRDLVNQGERGMARAATLLRSGALANAATRDANQLAQNYSASLLASDAHGIPLALIDDSAFTMTAADFVDAASGVTIRYVIDRQCTIAGVFDEGRCIATTATPADTSGSDFLKKAGGALKPVYRISVRVKGPRGTQAYLQTTAAL